ncbi:hypothetical protein ACE38V_01350 [Cytobacillus sp. Hz8]|uniref:hypothetical protein n=1 Tax=Cytobacillus sp. Hz8 TaxID=3347168 RepID=UPI0035DE88FD
MTRFLRLLTAISSAILFIVLVFMNLLGLWTANSSIRILFFFIMVVAIFNAGIEIGKNLKNRN